MFAMKQKKPAMFSDKRRPYFDKKGNLMIPDSILFGGQVDPPLNPREWQILQFIEAVDDTGMNYKEKYLHDLRIDSRTSYWRAIKSLKEKGYLESGERYIF